MRQENKFLRFLTNLILPQHCLLCGSESSSYLCDRCLQDIMPYDGNRCTICSKPILSTGQKVVCPVCLSKKHYFDKGYSLFNYRDEKIKKVIEFIKFYNQPQLTKLLLYFKQYIKSLDVFLNCDYIIPVPMHKKDIKKRGYNQSVYISKMLSKITGIPVNYDALIKVKLTKKQVGLNYYQRNSNLLGAFEVRNLRKAVKVVLADDVFTTGSTINECSRVLCKNKISSDFFTIATIPSGLSDDNYPYLKEIG